MTSRDRQLDRLCKLLALEGSPNACEAASARKMAESLMRRHGLTRADAAAHQQSGYCELSLGARGWDSPWRLVLVTAAARRCGADAVCLLCGKRRKVRLCGDRGDVERAARLHADLLAIVFRLERDAADLADSRNVVAFYGHLLVEGFSLDDVLYDADSVRRGLCAGLVELMAAHDSAGDEGAGGGGPEPAVPVVPPEAPGVPAPAAPPAGKGVLARVPGRRSGHEERVRARYSPSRRAVDLADATSSVWFELGRSLALSRAAATDDGIVLKKRPRAKKGDRKS